MEQKNRILKCVFIILSIFSDSPDFISIVMSAKYWYSWSFLPAGGDEDGDRQKGKLVADQR